MNVIPYNFIKKRIKEIESNLKQYCSVTSFSCTLDFETCLNKKLKDYVSIFKNDLYCLFSDNDLNFEIKAILNSDINFSHISISGLNLKSELVLLEEVDYYKFIKNISKNYNKYKYIIRDYKKDVKINNYDLYLVYDKIAVYILKEENGF